MITRATLRRSGIGAITCLVGFFAAMPAAAADVLKTAHRVGKELDGWKHGDDAKAQRINDVQFTLRVVEALGVKLKDDAKQRILLSDLTDSSRSAATDELVAKRDRRTHGVAHALVEAGLAHAVKLEDAKPGDFIQYWMKRKSKDDDDEKSEKKAPTKDEKKNSDVEPKWVGHAGVIEKVETNKKNELKAWVYSSHRFTNGVGIAPTQGLRLVDEEDRRIYVVRWGKPENVKSDSPSAKSDK